METTKTYLISLNTLKKDYPIDDNLEDKYIIPNISKGQDFIIRPLLGEDKWKEIITQIDEDSVTAKNNELIKDYIQPCLAYYVISEILYSTAYKLKNEGVENATDKFNELIKVSNKYLNDSNHYQSILKNWMILYGGVAIAPKFEYKCGLYLGRTNRIDYDNLPPNK